MAKLTGKAKAEFLARMAKGRRAAAKNPSRRRMVATTRRKHARRLPLATARYGRLTHAEAIQIGKEHRGIVRQFPKPHARPKKRNPLTGAAKAEFLARMARGRRAAARNPLSATAKRYRGQRTIYRAVTKGKGHPRTRMSGSEVYGYGQRARELEKEYYAKTGKAKPARRKRNPLTGAAKAEFLARMAKGRRAAARANPLSKAAKLYRAGRRQETKAMAMRKGRAKMRAMHLAHTKMLKGGSAYMGEHKYKTSQSKSGGRRSARTTREVRSIGSLFNPKSKRANPLSEHAKQYRIRRKSEKHYAKAARGIGRHQAAVQWEAGAKRTREGHERAYYAATGKSRPKGRKRTHGGSGYLNPGKARVSSALLGRVAGEVIARLPVLGVMLNPSQKSKVRRVLGEYSRGTLRTSSGQKVRTQKQAVAIALSEARRMGNPRRGRHGYAARVKRATREITASRKASGVKPRGGWLHSTSALAKERARRGKQGAHIHKAKMRLVPVGNPRRGSRKAIHISRKAGVYAPGGRRRGQNYVSAQRRMKAARAHIRKMQAARLGNPSTKDLFGSFQGRPSRSTQSVTTPTGTPKDIYKLGRLRKLKYTGGSISFPSGNGKAPFLAADKRGKLHVAGGAYRVNSEPKDLGRLHTVEYETRKPHLGAPDSTRFFHHFGENGGTKPTVAVDREGLLKIKGGSYRISSDGIIN